MPLLRGLYSCVCPGSRLGHPVCACTISYVLTDLQAVSAYAQSAGHSSRSQYTGLIWGALKPPDLIDLQFHQSLGVCQAAPVVLKYTSYTDGCTPDTVRRIRWNLKSWNRLSNAGGKQGLSQGPSTGWLRGLNQGNATPVLAGVITHPTSWPGKFSFRASACACIV